MSTKITSSALALAVALGATAPAFAQSDPDIELFLRHPGAAATPGREHAISAQLEASIRAFNTPQSLPIFTIGDADNILRAFGNNESLA